MQRKLALCPGGRRDRRTTPVRLLRLLPVVETFNAHVLRAVCAAEEAPVSLHAVPDDAAATVRTGRREYVNRALERVERVSGAGHGHRERLVVVVTTELAFCHCIHPRR